MIIRQTNDACLFFMGLFLIFSRIVPFQQLQLMEKISKMKTITTENGAILNVRRKHRGKYES